jgi:hypothetical protein
MEKNLKAAPEEYAAIEQSGGPGLRGQILVKHELAKNDQITVGALYGFLAAMVVVVLIHVVIGKRA